MTPKEPVDTINETHATYDRAPRLPRIEQLISDGRLQASIGDLLELGRPLDAPHDISISDALSQQRSEI